MDIVSAYFHNFATAFTLTSLEALTQMGTNEPLRDFAVELSSTVRQEIVNSQYYEVPSPSRTVTFYLSEDSG